MTIKIHVTRTVLVLLCIAATCLFAVTSESYGVSAPEATATITESDGVNIRSSYSTSSSIVGAIPYQSTVYIEKEKYTVAGSSNKTDIWYKISSSYGDGYIRSDLASVNYSYREGKTTSTINYRKGPGTDFSSEGTLEKGTQVKVALAAETAAGSSWYKIYYNNAYYYISASYVDMDSFSEGTEGGALTDAQFEAMLESEGFPESYKTMLRKLHVNHPNWKFRAKHVDFTWEEALNKQCANSNANLVSRNFSDGFKSVQKGDYDFDKHTYIGKDGDSWVSASKEGVAYYMDPRNWLTESSIFMFEPNNYDPTYQTESLVKKILSTTALPSTAAKYYISAAEQTYNGKKYVISPVYLATKTRQELGSSDFMINGHKFTYSGKTFENCYNVYNIGSVDSPDGSAATKGLVYAAGGVNKTDTSYLRPWNTLEKAVKGGAIYIASTFLERDQYTSYYERYNIMNGLSGIGTYQYATAIFSAATQASLIQNNYYDFGVLNESFTFEIPVYKSMPSTIAAKPGAASNNCYLDSITVSAGDQKLSFTKSFDRFTSNYTVKTAVGASVDKLTIKTTKNDNDATVTISGNSLKEGDNKITIKVKSPSGKYTKNYYVTVSKDSSLSGNPNQDIIDGVEGTSLTASSELGDGYIRINWEKSYGYKVDYFEIFKSTKSGNYDSKPLYTTTDGTKRTMKNTSNLVSDTRYYYRVRGVRVIDGTKYYTKWSNEAVRTYKNPESPENPNQDIIDGVEATALAASSELGDGYIRINWEKSYGYKVDYFEVFKSTKSGTYDSKPLYTTTDGTKRTMKNTSNLVNGTRYYYRVRGVRVIDGTKYYTQWSNEANRIYKSPENPNQDIIDGVEGTTLTASSELGDGYIRINWEKSYGYKVDYFEVFKSTKSGSYGSKPLYTTTDGTKRTLKNTSNLVNGTRYYYKVRGVRVINGTKYYTKWSNQANRIYK